MISSLYLPLMITSITGALVAVLILIYKQINNTELYKEGVRNENDGHYMLALQNFEEALNENRKLKLDTKFGVKISQRIKVLRNFMGYENSFQIGRPTDISNHFTYTMNK
jgi:CRISPR/Cas system-associated protein Cas5 (RAMP superfamily)